MFHIGAHAASARIGLEYARACLAAANQRFRGIGSITFAAAPSIDPAGVWIVLTGCHVSVLRFLFRLNIAYKVAGTTNPHR